MNHIYSKIETHMTQHPPVNTSKDVKAEEMWAPPCSLQQYSNSQDMESTECQSIDQWIKKI